MRKTIVSTLLCTIVTLALAFTPTFASFAAENNEDTYPLEIDGDAVIGCNSAASGEISINYPVTSIESNAFQGLKDITSVSMPNTVTSIAESAFKDCTKLTTMCIPENVQTIEKSTFENCTSLQTVYIPSSVTKIDDLAFKNCTSLQKVYYFGEKADWEKVSIGNSNDTLNDKVEFHPTHTFSDWTTDSANENVKSRTCSVCGYKELQVAATSSSQDDQNNSDQTNQDDEDNQELTAETDQNSDDNQELTDQTNQTDQDNDDNQDQTDQTSQNNQDDQDLTDQTNQDNQDNQNDDDSSSPKTGDPIEDLQWYTQVLITAVAILIITLAGRFLLD